MGAKLPGILLSKAYPTSIRIYTHLCLSRPGELGFFTDCFLRDRNDNELNSVHPEMGKFGRDRGAQKKLTAGIWLIFRGLNFLRNKDIGQIGHFWMDTDYVALCLIFKHFELFVNRSAYFIPPRSTQRTGAS